MENELKSYRRLIALKRSIPVFFCDSKLIPIYKLDLSEMLTVLQAVKIPVQFES